MRSCWRATCRPSTPMAATAAAASTAATTRTVRRSGRRRVGAAAAGPGTTRSGGAAAGSAGSPSEFWMFDHKVAGACTSAGGNKATASRSDCTSARAASSRAT